jgi:hypothetical protein
MLLRPLRNAAIDRILSQFQDGITGKIGSHNNGIPCLFHIDLFDVGKPISRNDHPPVCYSDSHKMLLIHHNQIIVYLPLAGEIWLYGEEKSSIFVV